MKNLLSLLLFRMFILVTTLGMLPCGGCKKQPSHSTPDNDPMAKGTPFPEWKADASLYPEGSQAMSGSPVPFNKYFPLYEPFLKHNGKSGEMTAWKVPMENRTWWVVDTRWSFQRESDAQRFLTSQKALLSEGHPLMEPEGTVGPLAVTLFAGRILHPSLGTPFWAFVAVGRHEHHVFKFLAAVEVAPTPDSSVTAPSPCEEKIEHFLRIASLALRVP